MLQRSKRGWVWNQFFVIEEYTGPDPVLVGRVSLLHSMLMYLYVLIIGAVWHGQDKDQAKSRQTNKQTEARHNKTKTNKNKLESTNDLLSSKKK